MKLPKRRYTPADHLYSRLLGLPGHPAALELSRNLRKLNTRPKAVQDKVRKEIRRILREGAQ